MILLYLMHDKAEKEKKANEKQRFPIPYYVMSFVGSACKNKTLAELKNQLDFLFESSKLFLPIYNFYKTLTETYTQNLNQYKDIEYNVMIKQEIDVSIFENCFDSALQFTSEKERIKKFVGFGRE